MGLLDGRVVLVAGVGPGLGKEVARTVLAEGGSVVMTDIVEDLIVDAQNELDPGGERTLRCTIDLQNDSTIEAAVSSLRERFGRLDAVVQVAAYAGAFDLLADRTVENWELTSDINVAGTLRVIRAATGLLQEDGGGSVVIVGSTAGVLPTVGYTQTAYGISKAALVAATHYLSKELGVKGIRVNNVAPGYKMGPALRGALEAWAEEANTSVEAVSAPILDGLALRRFADDVDVASAILFFISDLSKNVTGQTLYVDGGMVLH
jgi:NAD(P)-dependent dehydrogenase (short-subunit alcohol dehydrogenase family)